MGSKKRFVKLTEEKRIALHAGFKTGKKATFRQRCHFILLSDQGYSIQQIAELYQVTRQAVSRWFDRYESLGIEGLHTKKGQGEKPILRIDNNEHVQTVKNLMETHAQDLDPVLAILEKRLGKSMSKRTLQRFLKRLVTPGNAFEE